MFFQSTWPLWVSLIINNVLMIFLWVLFYYLCIKAYSKTKNDIWYNWSTKIKEKLLLASLINFLINFFAYLLFAFILLQIDSFIINIEGKNSELTKGIWFVLQRSFIEFLWVKISLIIYSCTIFSLSFFFLRWYIKNQF